MKLDLLGRPRDKRNVRVVLSFRYGFAPKDHREVWGHNINVWIVFCWKFCNECIS